MIPFHVTQYNPNMQKHGIYPKEQLNQDSFEQVMNSNRTAGYQKKIPIKFTV